MALFKPFSGNRANLTVERVPLTEGHAYFCVDDGTFHIDARVGDEVQRIQLNAKDAETLSGMSLDEIKEYVNTQLGAAVKYTEQELTEEQKEQALKNIGLIKNQKPLKNGDAAPSTIYFDTSKDLEQWFTSLPYTKDGGGWDSYYIYGDWSSNVRFHVTQYDITQTDDYGTQILVGHYYTLSYEKRDSNQIIVIYVSNDVVDSFFKSYEELMGLKLVKGWNTNLLDTSAIAGMSLNLPDNTDFMYSDSLAGSKELYLKNGVQVLTEEEKLQIQENIGLMKKGLKPIEIGDSLVAGAVTLDTSLNLDEWLASLTYDENYPITPLYVCSLNIAFSDEEPTTTEEPILISFRNPLSDGSYCYMIIDAIAVSTGNLVGGTLYVSSNASNEVLASVGATTTGWQMTEYNSMERLATIGATVNSCVVTSVPEVGFAGTDGVFIETYLTKKPQSLTEAEKLQVQANIGLTNKGKPLVNGDVIPSTIYFDTSRDIDKWLASLDYGEEGIIYAATVETDNETLGIAFLDMSILSSGEITGYYMAGTSGILYVDETFFNSLPEAVKIELGISKVGWQVESSATGALEGTTFSNLPDGCDFISATPFGNTPIYLTKESQTLTESEQEQVLVNLGLEVRSSFESLKVGDIISGTCDFDTTQNLDEMLAGLTYITSDRYPTFEMAGLYDANVTISGIDAVQVQPILIALKYAPTADTVYYGLVDNAGYQSGNLVALYASHNCPDELLTQLGATQTGWQVSEYDGYAAFATLGVTVISVELTSVPSIGFAGTKIEGQKVVLAPMIPKPQPLAVGDTITGPVYIDTSVDIESVLAGLTYSESDNTAILYTGTVTENGETIDAALFMAIRNELGNGAYTYMLGDYFKMMAGTMNGMVVYVSPNAPEDMMSTLASLGVTTTGWQVTQLPDYSAYTPVISSVTEPAFVYKTNPNIDRVLKRKADGTILWEEATVSEGGGNSKNILTFEYPSDDEIGVEVTITEDELNTICAADTIIFQKIGNPSDPANSNNINIILNKVAATSGNEEFIKYAIFVSPTEGTEYNGTYTELAVMKLGNQIVKIFSKKNYGVSVDTALSTSSTNPVQNKVITTEFDAVKERITTLETNSGNSIAVDTEMSETSENPVQNKVITSVLSEKVNMKDLAEVATSGSYNDLTDKPTIPTVPTNVSAFTNDAGYLTEHQDISGKADLVDGKVPTSQLPSYVDDVLEYNTYNSLPATGETGKIYVILDDNKTYRWSGSAYVEISASLALGETSSTAYRGDRGKVAYDHSQTTSGNPHRVTAVDVGLGNVKNIDTTNAANITSGTLSDARLSSNIARISQIPTIPTGVSAFDNDSGYITANNIFDFICLKDRSNGTTYMLSVVNGSLITEKLITEEDLVDFAYTKNDDGTYTITDWNGTYQGGTNTKVIIPDSSLIKY